MGLLRARADAPGQSIVNFYAAGATRGLHADTRSAVPRLVAISPANTPTSRFGNTETRGRLSVTVRETGPGVSGPGT